MNSFEKLQRDPFSRRAFLQRMSAAGLGIAAINLLNGCGGGGNNNGGSSGGSFPLAGAVGRNDNERVLNFAYSLEILEADLYRQALNLAAGLALTTPLARTPSSYSLAIGTGGLSGADATSGFDYLRQFAFVEAAHRDFLSTVLSSLNAPKVTPNPGGYKFASTPATNLRSILQAILPLEETGVRAYLGAAPFLTDFSIAQTATAIYSTEARHSAAIRYIVDPDRNPGPSPQDGDGKVTSDYPHEFTFEYFLTPTQVSNAIKPMLA